VHHLFSHGLHLRAHGGDHICFIRVHLECRFAALAQLTFNSSSKIKTLHSYGFDPRRTSPVRGGSAAQARQRNFAKPTTCPSRKSYPRIAMVQSGKYWRSGTWELLKSRYGPPAEMKKARAAIVPRGNGTSRTECHLQRAFRRNLGCCFPIGHSRPTAGRTTCSRAFLKR
jgi:hypothetical protein